VSDEAELIHVCCFACSSETWKLDIVRTEGETVLAIMCANCGGSTQVFAIEGMPDGQMITKRGKPN
jgi:uncharacterized Zn finger protein